MNTIYKKTLSILVFMGGAFMANSQNLDLLHQAQRDSFLIATAKEVVMKYGPGYYREYKAPIIRRGIAPNDAPVLGGTMEDAGRIYYSILFLYDKSKEQLEQDFAVGISIWENTGRPFSMTFGNGLMVTIPEDINWRNDNSIEPKIYQQREIRPQYDWMNHPENKEPINKEELIQNGYEEQENGQWVKVKPDIPPRY
jgi:hypothetical protein